jgi:NAD(P) transhydrogenase subunit beta
MTANISALLYLASSVCFILAIKGLSSSDTARQGNFLGVLGLAIAIGTTSPLPIVKSLEVIIGGILIGGVIGTVIAQKTQMTALPQLIAASNSLVGLAACFVAAAAFSRPEVYGIGSFLDIRLATLMKWR